MISFTHSLKSVLLLLLLIHLSPLQGFSQNKIWKGDLKPGQFAAFSTGNYSTVTGNVFVYKTNLKDLSQLQNLEIIEGNLYIGMHDIIKKIKEGNDNLLNLNGLEKLISVSGKLQITQNKVLENISALSNLQNVHGGLDISHNDTLLNLNGLENLKVVKKYLSISNNRSLQNIVALKYLHELEGDLSINHNISLKSLHGIENISKIDGSLTIRSNENLPSLTGIKLTKIGGGLNIANNTILNNLKPLHFIDSIPGSVLIANNNALKNLDGMQRLVFIGEKLEVESNDNLTSLAGLDNINQINGDIIINKNTNLKHFESLNKLKTVGGDVNILSNPNLIELNGLHHLEEVKVDISIYNNEKMVNIKGFESLCTVKNDISLYSNALLTNLTSLNKLTYIGRNFYIIENLSITELSGLENLKIIGGNCKIALNKNLKNIDAFPALLQIKEDLTIQENKSLKSICNFNSLKTVDKYMTIEKNDSLLSVSGFNSLDSIHSHLWFMENPLLSKVDGFKNLSYINDLWLNQNKDLSVVSGFNKLNFCGELFIDQSPLLTNIDAFSNIAKMNSMRLSDVGIENLNGFSLIKKIGRVNIHNNLSLNHIEGLNNLKLISNSLYLNNNPKLSGFNGLSNLESVRENIEIKNNKELVDISGLKKLICVGEKLEITENERLQAYHGLNPVLLNKLKHYNVHIFGNCYNPNLSMLLAGRYVNSPNPLVRIPLIKNGLINYSPDFDNEVYDEATETMEESVYWRRGTIFRSNLDNEKLFHVRVFSDNNNLRIYFMGASFSKCSQSEVCNINIYELNPDGSIYIIDNFQVSLPGGYLDDYITYNFDNIIIASGKVYYHKTTDFSKINEDPNTFINNLKYYEYKMGSKQKSIALASQPIRLVYTLDNLNRCAFSPDHSKVAWTAHIDVDINIANNKNAGDYNNTLFRNSLKFNRSRGDLKVSSYFPNIKDEYPSFGGLCWNKAGNTLYFDNSGISYACIWKWDLKTQKVTKIIPEHEAIHPYCFTFKNKEMIAYVQENCIMIGEPQ